MLIEHDEMLFRVETTEGRTFYLMACCFTEAAMQAEAYCDANSESLGVPVSVMHADGELIVDDGCGDEETEDPVADEKVKTNTEPTSSKSN